MNRLGYGPSPWFAARYDKLGFNGFVEEQLGTRTQALTDTSAGAGSLMHRSILEQRQLETMLLEFWFNHFNVDAGTGPPTKKGMDAYLAGIHSHVRGTFGDMLLTTAQSVSMLDYLDNRVNFKPHTRGGKEYGLNENYARELMELHTLGVDAGYTQEDVIDVARIMSGWTIRNRPSLGMHEYRFIRSVHDEGAKTVMGRDYPADRGEEEGVELLAQLADHDATASFISRKLCRRLVHENPSSQVVDAATDAFSSSGGDLMATVRAIIASPEFTDEAAFRSKVKSPHRYLASAMRAMGVTTADEFAPVKKATVGWLGPVGEDPFKVAPPTGYPESSGYWISSGTMLARFSIAGKIAYNDGLRERLKATAGVRGRFPDRTVDAVAAWMCPGGISEGTRQAAIDHVSEQPSKNLRISATAHALLSSPEFLRF